MAVAVVIAVVLAFVFGGHGTSTKKANTGQVMLEPAASGGPDPFTASVAKPAPPISAPAPSFTPVPHPTTGPPPTVVRTETGNTVGLYGGTQNLSHCDAAQMGRFLAENPSKASAWVQALNADPNLRWSGGTSVSTAQIPAFLGDLTPVILRADTVVTNNGFANGQPTPRESILQTGTAVLVDKFGVPRARCACGNPLSPPHVNSTVKFTGTPWPAFSPTTLVVVNSAPTVVNTFVLVNVNNGTTYPQPAGNPSIPKTVPPPATAPPTGSSPPTTGAPPTTSTPMHYDFDVTSISPGSAPAGGGTTLTITGYGFTSHGGVANVQFVLKSDHFTVVDNGTFKVVSDTTITFTMNPASSNGGCNPNGCTADLEIGFNDQSFGATSVPNNTGGNEVPFSAPPFTITPAVPPPTPQTTSPVTPAPPTTPTTPTSPATPPTTTTTPDVGVTAMTPDFGPPAGGTTVTVTGFGFTGHGGIDAVDLQTSSGYEAAPATFTPGSDTQFTFTTGPGTSNGGCDQSCAAHLHIAFKDGTQVDGPTFTIGTPLG